MNILSLGVAMTQARVTLEQAQELGIISFLTFLKVKSVDQWNQNPKTDPVLYFKYAALKESSDALIDAIIHEISKSNTIDVYRQMDEVYRTTSEFKKAGRSGMERLIKELNFNAGQFIQDPIMNFGSRIQAIQSLGFIRTFDHMLQEENLVPSGRLDHFIDMLHKLKMETVKTSYPLVREVA